MKKLLWISLILALAMAANAQSDKRLKGLDKELNALLIEWEAAGFAVAVVEKKQIIYENGFGYRDYANKEPVTPNTLFAIGSCTKAFTAGLLGILEGEGKLSLDDKPSKHIPGYEFFNEELNSGVTIKDMMTHRTGIPRHDFSWYLFPTDSKDELIERIRYMEPFAPLRSRWYYNNFMYLTQGVIAEKITGKSWEDNIRESILDPLGMKTSNLSIDELENVENRALGYGKVGEENKDPMDYYRISGMGPAGSINSSVHEMSNWLITWINSGKFDGEEVFPSSYYTQAISSQMVIGAGLPDKDVPDLHLSNYGYGWMIASYKGHYRVEHGGNIDGFSASACFYPSDSIGIVVLANQNGSSIPSIVRNMISDRMLGVEKTDWSARLMESRKKGEEAAASKKENRVEGTNPSHPLENYTGTYEHKGYGTLTIELRNDSLFARSSLDEVWLKHFHYDVFEAYDVEDGVVDTNSLDFLKTIFRTGMAGEISGLELQLEPTLDPLFFEREPLGIEVGENVLEQYVGEYTLGAMVAKVYLKNDNTLYLFVPGQPEYTLVPTRQHYFSIKGLTGFNVEFFESSEGEIDAVTFHQPNGSFRAERK